jgi:acetolactate synthase regulatory subunit
MKLIKNQKYNGNENMIVVELFEHRGFFVCIIKKTVENQDSYAVQIYKNEGDDRHIEAYCDIESIRSSISVAKAFINGLLH